jgi:hypothetical protein
MGAAMVYTRCALKETMLPPYRTPPAKHDMLSRMKLSELNL